MTSKPGSITNHGRDIKNFNAIIIEMSWLPLNEVADVKIAYFELRLYLWVIVMRNFPWCDSPAVGTFYFNHCT